MGICCRFLGIALTGALAAAAQLGLPTPPAPKPTQTSARDPLGRDTPRAALTGFLKAAQDGKFLRAAQFLQLKSSERGEREEEIAKQMAAVMTVQFKSRMEDISDQPEGQSEDGRSGSRELAGYLGTHDEPVPLTLVRVAGDDGRRIWLISAETLARLPKLYAQVSSMGALFRLPDWMQERWLGMRLWQWLAFPGLLPPALAIAWLLLLAGRLPVRIYQWLRGRTAGAWWKTATPNLVCVTIWVHYVLASQVALPVLVREHHGHIARGTIFVWMLWWLWHFGNAALTRARERAMATSRTAEGSLIQLGQKILKALLAVVIVLILLSTLGFDMSTALAGIGIGGIAIALAAQKTIENLFGGISLATDKVIRVGDMCRIGTDLGWIEEIGLRSTRLRSLEGSELTIPNSALSTMTLENYSMRDRCRFYTKIGLRYETSAAQMKEVIGGVHALLERHAKISPVGLRVCLLAFEAYSLDIEVQAFVATSNFDEYTAVREELLLGIMDIVEQAGTGLAFPSQTIYMRRDAAPKPAAGGSERE